MVRRPRSALMRKACVSATLSSPLDRAGLIPSPARLFPAESRNRRSEPSQNLKAVLEAGGSSLGQVVKATVFLKDMNDFAAMNAVYASFFGTDCETLPARTTVEVARLPRNLLVEIEVVAEV